MHNIRINVVFSQVVQCSIYISKKRNEELQGKVWDRTRGVIRKGEDNFKNRAKKHALLNDA